jgi:hypothetical protein
VHRESIASQLADGTADFLLDRLPVVVEKAVDGLAYERVQQPDGTLLSLANAFSSSRPRVLLHSTQTQRSTAREEEFCYRGERARVQRNAAAVSAAVGLSSTGFILYEIGWTSVREMR